MNYGIILDGAEQQGKSTLAAKLSKLLGYPIRHFDKPPKNFDFWEDYFIEAESNCPWLLDRCFTSELVYGKYFNRNRISDEHKARLEKRFTSLNYMFVLCELNNDWIDRDETVTKEQNIEIKKLYRDMYNNLNMPKIIVRPDENGIKQILKLHNKIIGE